MEIHSSRERVLHWIVRKIAIDWENAVWVTTTPTLIMKASLSFPAKVWWAVVRAQLRSTANDNTLSPSLASFVACLMVGYPINVGLIIAIEMRDRALNERAGLSFPCLIGKLCRQANIPPNSAKSATMGTLVVVLHVQIDIPHADRGPEQWESSQPSTEAPPPPVQPRWLQAPSTQSLDDFWGELPKSKSGKRKHKAGESDEELPTDLSREEIRTQNKAHRASRRKARENEELEQQQRDAVLLELLVAEHLPWQVVASLIMC
uniref:Putative plant transposon protein domain-containing protein n=1 Tax=Solanum tuberosum TaxID=4113 RepID=M1D9H8_SOLTU